MYDESKDEDDLEEIIFEDPHAEDLGDLELQDMKSQIGNLEKKINVANEKLGLTRKNIQLLTTTIKVEQKEDFKKLVEQVEEERKGEAVSTTEIPEEEGDEDVDTDDEDLAHYLEEKDSGSEDEAVEQLNPVEASVIKLKDKISLLKNRCEAGLGYDLTEKMYKIALKANRENQSSDRT